MKTTLKLMLAAGLLSAGFVGTASAQTDVYLTGSSAFRNAVSNSIAHLLTTPVGVGDGSSFAGSTHQVFKGTISGTTYYFHTCWTGSLSGLISVTNPTTAQNAYWPETAADTSGTALTPGTGADSSHGLSGGATVATATFTLSNHAADGAFSDVYITSTPYNVSSAKQAGGNKVLGVVPFVFVGNPDLKAFVPTGSPITNISAVQAKQLYAGGLDLAQLTGNDTDDANSVGFAFPVGRDADSGTRFTTFAETGFNPIGGSKQPTQYTVSTSGTSVLVDEFPVETLFPGTPQAQVFTLGQGGYASGGNEQASLNIVGTAGANSDNPSYIIGSLGESDAKTAVSQSNTANNAYFLSYNGQGYGTVTYTTSGTTTTAAVTYNRTALKEGAYTFWGYEHEYYLNGNANATVLDSLATEVRTVDAGIAGEFTPNMAVQRDVEGGPISYVGIGNSTK